MSVFDPKRTWEGVFPADNGLLQLCGVLVKIGGGEDWAAGAAGDNTNVSQSKRDADIAKCPLLTQS
jgi:hypothetical protein